MDQVIVSKDSFESKDASDIIYSNISFINVLREEGFEGELCHEAQISYYVDYYLAQVKNGGFSQFVYNSGWNDELNTLILEGLERMSARQYLVFFKQQSQIVNDFDEFKLAVFLDGDYFGKNPTRDALNNDEFFNIPEDLVALNADWLRSLPNLEVLTIDHMFEKIESVLGRAISRE